MQLCHSLCLMTNILTFIKTDCVSLPPLEYPNIEPEPCAVVIGWWSRNIKNPAHTTA